MQNQLSRPSLFTSHHADRLSMGILEASIASVLGVGLS
jgi:hypothetical protein